MTKAVNFYFHVHQPYRVRHYTVFDTGEAHDYFNESVYDSPHNNEAVFRKVADKSYRPMTALLRDLLYQYPDFKFSLSITGIFIEQAEQWAPDVLDAFKQLVATGRVEILAETYYHSLAFYYSRDEFERQVDQHRQAIQRVFGVTPTAFRNTELAYDNQVGTWAQAAGYQAVIAEGWDTVLDWRSPNFAYRPPHAETTRLLLKNYRLSDDIAFRFSNRAWNEYPLTAHKYAQWLESAFDHGTMVNLFMDFETFGEHQWGDTGIFDFMRQIVGEWLGGDDHAFMTITEAAQAFPVEADLDVPHTITWADSERDLSAWQGNALQQEILRHLYSLEHAVLRSGDDHLIHDWRLLQASDLPYYMSTKYHADGDVHAYFSPYDSPYDAFLYVMNIIRDIRWRLMVHHGTGRLHG